MDSIESSKRANGLQVRKATIEECAKIADEHSSPPFGHDDPVAVNYWHLGEAYARKEIAAEIRALLPKQPVT